MVPQRSEGQGGDVLRSGPLSHSCLQFLLRPENHVYNRRNAGRLMSRQKPSQTLHTQTSHIFSPFFSCCLSFSCKFSFYSCPLIPSLHLPFPTHLSLIGTHTCMQLETFSQKLKGHTPVESCRDALWGFTPLFALECVQIGHGGQPAISPLTDIDEGDLTFQATQTNTKQRLTHRNNEVYGQMDYLIP